MLHRLEIDIDQDEFAGLSAERLISYIERLSAYDGALAARIYQIQEQEKNRNPSRDALSKGAQFVDSSALASHPEFAGAVEIVNV